jgi:hypothetical protein
VWFAVLLFQLAVSRFQEAELRCYLEEWRFPAAG